MRTKFAIGVAVLLLLAGCKNFGTQAFRTEQVITDVTFTAYVGYTNALANGTLKISATESNEVKSARIKMAATKATFDGWLSAYETNSAVKPQLQAALDALKTDSASLIQLINILKNK